MNPNAGLPPGMMEVIIVAAAIGIAIGILINVLFLLNLHKTLKAVREPNREMSPGMVWLNLIPVFNYVWAIIMVQRIGNSLEREYEARGRRTADEGFGRTAGTIWAWGAVVSLVITIVQYALQFADMMIPSMLVSLLGMPISIALLVCFILYWVQTYQYRKRLAESPSDEERDFDDRYDRGDDGSGRRDPDDDFDRDRPRRDDYGR